MKRILIVCFFINIVVGCYPQSTQNKFIKYSPCPFPLEHSPGVICKEIPLIDENEVYDYTIDFISCIKHSYYIGAHAMIADTIVYIKILSPKIKGYQGYKKIKPGKIYPMQVKLLYPNPLKHSLECYYHYVFPFNKKLVCLQATDCMKYIFMSDNLKGLRHIQNNDKDTLPQFMQCVNTDSFANKIILSILKKDSINLSTDVDTVSVINCLKKNPCGFSIVDLNRVRCLPSYRIKKSDEYTMSEIRSMSTSNKLLYGLLKGYYVTNCVVSDILSVNFIESKMIYYEQPYITYRVTWSSPQLPDCVVTYMSFKYYEGKYSLVSISSNIN